MKKGEEEGEEQEEKGDEPPLHVGWIRPNL